MTDAIWITERDEGVVAREIASARARNGALAGWRLAVKDNIDVAGLPTTVAHPQHQNVPVASATVVDRLVVAGAVVTGKTNLDQFATGLVGTRSPYGACANPAVPSRIAGGSSSGSALAVATGAADIALGTDTAGSGRVPAALCGVVGLKPTRGLLPVTGVVPACRSLDCVSVFAPTVSAATAAVNIAAGPDGIDPLARRPPIGTAVVTEEPLRVGMPRAADLAGLDAAAEREWAYVLTALDRIGALVEVDITAYIDAGALVYGGYLAERWLAVGPFLASHPDGADPTVAAVIAGGADMPALRLAEDLERQAQLSAAASTWWDDVDVVCVPTVGEAPTLTEVAADPFSVNVRLGRYTAGCNPLDLCGAAVPYGTRTDGVPFGVTFLGPAFADHVVAVAGARLLGEPDPAPPAWAGWTTIVVVGAHLTGQPLSWQLTDRGGRLARRVLTSPEYRLVALATDPPKPGLVRLGPGASGASIEGELWALPIDGFGDFVRKIPAPLVIGTVVLDDGSSHPGFLCEPWATAGAPDITSYGGWKRYLAAGQ
jgi:allophanate hydrolase